MEREQTQPPSNGSSSHLSPFRQSHLRLPPEADDPPLRLRLSFSMRADPDSWDVSKAPKPMRAAVLHRDANCCLFCGFRSKKYQDVIVRGGRLHDMSAMVTACAFCAQVVTLESVPEMKSGVLIEAPHINQADLHALAMLIYVCRITQGDAGTTARALLDVIIRAREGASRLLGYDDPRRLVDAMRACRTDGEAAALAQRCTSIRLFPLDRRIIKENDLEFNQFPQMLAYWRSKDGPFGPSGILTPPLANMPLLDDVMRLGVNSPVRWRFDTQA